MAEVEMRRARVEDAEEIARVHLRTWQAAYRHVFPPAELDALPLERRIAGWQRGLREQDDICFVAGEPIAGFVLAETCADEPEAGEIDAIYVEPSAWGKGIGRALLAQAEVELKARGFDQAILWVLEDNPRARSFYEAAGWSLDGGRKTWPQMGVEAPVVRYRKHLAGG